MTIALARAARSSGRPGYHINRSNLLVLESKADMPAQRDRTDRVLRQVGTQFQHRAKARRFAC
jgi:hypothetical protein